MNNPFKLLNVVKTASKKEILRKVTDAMRSRQYNAKEIAEAQKRLFNIHTRAADEFKHFLDVERCTGSLPRDQSAMDDALDIPLLDVFDA